MAETVLRIRIGEDPPPRLDKALAAFAPEDAALSRSRIARLIAEGAVRHVAEAAPETSPRRAVVAGDEWELRLPPPRPIAAEPEAIPLTVVHEDEHLIVVDKPAGMVVHPGPGAERGTLVNALLHHCAGRLSGIGGRVRPGIVHRIDKDTSGLLVVARTDAAHHGLAAQFRAHSVSRHYTGLCHGVPMRGDPRLAGVRGVAFEAGGVIRISGNIARHGSDRKRMAVVRDAGRHAITRLKVLRAFGTRAALLDLWLETGRTHQIRVHLAHAGHGLLGDPVYGGRRQMGLAGVPDAARRVIRGFVRQALHAASLGFTHPVTGKRMEFHSPLPADMAALVAALEAITGADDRDK